MSRIKDRDEFMVLMDREGVSREVARLVMRHGATLQRLAEAQCNGDYPADNGERKVKQCPRCEQSWVPSFFVRDYTQPKIQGPGEDRPRWIPVICKECRIQDRVQAALKPYNVEPIFQGDPRGAVVKLKVPSGKTNDWGQEGICVP